MAILRSKKREKAQNHGRNRTLDLSCMLYHCATASAPCLRQCDTGIRLKSKFTLLCVFRSNLFHSRGLGIFVVPFHSARWRTCQWKVRPLRFGLNFASFGQASVSMREREKVIINVEK